MIEDAGGIDLQVLGIGNNGHIGFNEIDFKTTMHQRPDKKIISLLW